MNVYLVKYDGLWLGGKAVVLATSAEEAVALVGGHPKTNEFDDVKVEALGEALGPCVLYNDNGDY